MKQLLFIFVLLTTITATGQITKIYFQASGLTCSMCSNAINKSLRSLEFVDKVTANFSDYSFEVSFKTTDNIDFDRVRRKVEDAGFFVSAFYATIRFSNQELKSGQPVKAGANNLLFVNNKETMLNGETTVRVLNKGFVSAREYRNNPVSQTPAATGTYQVTL